MSTHQVCPTDGYLPSNFTFCETRLCAWVAEPANAWSCVGIAAVGVFILLRMRKDRAAGLWPIGATAIGNGILSWIYHAFPVFLTEYLDVLSMDLFSAYVLVATIHRAYGGGIRRHVLTYVAVLTACLAMMALVKPIGVFLFAAQIIAVLVLESRLRQATRGTGDPIDYRYLKVLLSVFATALVIWMLDTTRIACLPDNHWLQGHATWHLLVGSCFFWLYQFYRQFDFGGGSRRGAGLLDPQ